MSGTLTFAPGQTRARRIAVPIMDDNGGGQRRDPDAHAQRRSPGRSSRTRVDDRNHLQRPRTSCWRLANTVLTAAFVDLPTDGHGGSAFTLTLRFSGDLAPGVSARTLQDAALSVTNGTLTQVQRVTAGASREWTVTVTPAGAGDVTVALAATTDCTAAGAICNTDDVPLSKAVSVTVPQTTAAPAPQVIGVELVPDTSRNHSWTTGETLEVRLTFSEAVTVTDGTPSVAVIISGAGEYIELASGTGSDTLVFSRDVTDEDGKLAYIAVWPDSLTLNGANIVSSATGTAAELAHEGTEVTGAPFTPATRITEAAVTSDRGPNKTWDTGEVVTARLVFSTEVTVDDPLNVGPTLAITLDGTEREAAYAGGSGTDTLIFNHTVTADDDGARRARVVANGLTLGQATLTAANGATVEIGFAVAPWIEEVALMPDASGDSVWTPGEKVEVLLTFNEPVTVTEGTGDRGTKPRVQVTVAGTRASLELTSGSGTDTLHFSVTLPEANPAISQIAVTENGLELNSATIASTESGLEAELGHDATEATPEPGVEQPALTAQFVDVPENHDGNPFTFEVAFSEALASGFNAQTLAQSAIATTNATVSEARRIEAGNNRRWAITVEPSGESDVTITLAGGTACEGNAGVCTDDGRALSGTVAATVQRSRSPKDHHR